MKTWLKGGRWVGAWDLFPIVYGLLMGYKVCVQELREGEKTFFLVEDIVLQPKFIQIYFIFTYIQVGLSLLSIMAASEALSVYRLLLRTSFRSKFGDLTCCMVHVDELSGRLNRERV